MTEQPYLPTGGMEPPKNADVELAIDEWLTAKNEQRWAGDKTKIKHASLLEKLATAGIERYPFVDPRTGKKNVVACVREPKAKVMRGSRAKNTAKAERAEEKRKARRERNRDDDVEIRRVPRTAEHDRAADPFGATRGLLEEAEAAQDKSDVVVPDKAAPKSKKKASGKSGGAKKPAKPSKKGRSK